jgi:hypothetical protein
MTEKTKDPRHYTELWKKIEAACPDDSEAEKEKFYYLLSPEYKIAMLKDVIASMERTEQIALPLAFYGKKTKQERKRGGANSHEMTEDDRRERNERMQKEVTRLCVEKGKTFKSARVIVAKSHGLHPDSLKRIVKNPLK